MIMTSFLWAITTNSGQPWFIHRGGGGGGGGGWGPTLRFLPRAVQQLKMLPKVHSLDNGNTQ